MGSEVDVRFVDIGGIVHHHCLTFLSIINIIHVFFSPLCRVKR